MKMKGRVAAVGLLIGSIVWVQVVTTSSVGAQVPTPTPFRFLTPTPFVPSKTTTTTTTTTSPAPGTTTAPRAGGFPMELAIPALASGLAAIGGGAYVLRRKPAR
jgi:hypothetical protein